MGTLIFRTSQKQAEPPLPEGLSFHLADAPLKALKIAALSGQNFSLGATLKMLAKIATPSRAYYAVMREARIVSDGWIMFGRCRAYEIGRRDCVIGPINTEISERGLGLAHFALVRAINHCLNTGFNCVYIDTSEENYGSRRVIEKSGMNLFRVIN